MMVEVEIIFTAARLPQVQDRDFTWLIRPAATKVTGVPSTLPLIKYGGTSTMTGTVTTFFQLC
jgi:hypothetical protein